MLNIKSDNVIHLTHDDLYVDMTINKGEAVALLGDNGVGKSSFIQYLKINQREIFRGCNVSFLDQFRLMPLGVLRGIDLFEMLRSYAPKRVIYQSLDSYQLIDKFNFRDKLKTSINSLSGGENQILKILATFYFKTDFFCLDEPSNCLDPNRLNTVAQLIKDSLKDDKSFLIIDHKTELLKILCTHFMVFKKNQGKIYLNEYVDKEKLEDGLFNFY